MLSSLFTCNRRRSRSPSSKGEGLEEHGHHHSHSKSAHKRKHQEHARESSRSSRHKHHRHHRHHDHHREGSKDRQSQKRHHSPSSSSSSDEEKKPATVQTKGAATSHSDTSVQSPSQPLAPGGSTSLPVADHGNVDSDESRPRTLIHYIQDRERMVSEAFSCLSATTIDRLLPNHLQVCLLKPFTVKLECIEQNCWLRRKTC